MSARQCSPRPNVMKINNCTFFTSLKSCFQQVPDRGNLPSASDAALADHNHQYDLCSGDFEPSNDPFLVMGSQPARDYTLPFFSNVVVQPSTIPAPPLLPAPVLVSNISSQHPGTANQAPAICAQSNNMSNQVRENYTQNPVASNQGTLSAEEDRQKVMDAAEALLILHNSSQAPQGLRESED
ncbi:hypothetical protein APTSU1_001827900 [Apodemus speciosus]|uniref:Uncharacterized protein n=1 Tax=Apodemus speciosus TaxID=105296 RepID=A0ABQ0FUV4_APOSI